MGTRAPLRAVQGSLFGEADERSPVRAYIESLSTPLSQRSARSAVRVLAGLLSDGRCTVGTLDWASLRFDHVNALRAKLIRRYRPTSARRLMAVLRAVLKTARRMRLMTADEYESAIDVDPIRGSVVARGRWATVEEVQRLLDACNDGTVRGARDFAMIAVGVGCGVRRSELVGIDLCDYDPRSARIRVVKGKGDKERFVYPQPWAEKALALWTRLRGRERGPLFLPVVNQHAGARRAGHAIREVVVMRRLNPEAVRDSLKRRVERVGIPHLSPHDLRRTFITELLERGVDLFLVARLAGHENIQTTRTYDRRPEEAARAAAQRYDPTGGGDARV